MDLLPIDQLKGIFTSFVTLGVVLVIAAVVGRTVEIYGFKIPGVHGWPRQIVLAAVGLFLSILSAYGLATVQFDQDYQAIVNGAEGIPPPPLTRHQIEQSLERLAYRAGHDYHRNCLVASVISDNDVSPMPFIVVENLQTSQDSQESWLQCYRDVIAKASATAANHATQASAPTNVAAMGGGYPTLRGSGGAEMFAYHSIDPITSAASTASAAGDVSVTGQDPSTSILKAVTVKDTSGWMYLGRLNADGSLGSDRTVEEATVRQGQTISVTTNVYLRDPSVAGHYHEGKVVGVVTAGYQIKILTLTPRTDPFVWAKISVVSAPHS